MVTESEHSGCDDVKVNVTDHDAAEKISEPGVTFLLADMGPVATTYTLPTNKMKPVPDTTVPELMVAVTVALSAAIALRLETVLLNSS